MAIASARCFALSFLISPLCSFSLASPICTLYHGQLSHTNSYARGNLGTYRSKVSRFFLGSPVTAGDDSDDPDSDAGTGADENADENAAVGEGLNAENSRRKDTTDGDGNKGE